MPELLELFFELLFNLFLGVLELLGEVCWESCRAWISGGSLYRIFIAVATIVAAYGAFVWLILRG
jgi:hypothetical protein